VIELIAARDKILKRETRLVNMLQVSYLKYFIFSIASPVFFSDATSANEVVVQPITTL
jgi:hypothetical protein